MNMLTKLSLLVVASAMFACASKPSAVENNPREVASSGDSGPLSSTLLVLDLTSSGAISSQYKGDIGIVKQDAGAFLQEVALKDERDNTVPALTPALKKFVAYIGDAVEKNGTPEQQQFWRNATDKQKVGISWGLLNKKK